MKKIFKLLILTAISLSFTGCIKSFDPQTDYVSEKQAFNAPNAYQNFLNSVTSSLCGEFTYAGSRHWGHDFGYPAFMIMREMMGQDMFQAQLSWFDAWYTGLYLGADYATTQMPWTYYFKWIKNCNTVINITGDSPKEDRKAGAGIAHAMRAFFYMDLARYFAPKSYIEDPEALTVPRLDDKTTIEIALHNPRLSNKDMWDFILSDLNKAEGYLENFHRSDKTIPDRSVVYGLKARAYLEMGNYAEAKKYAKMAQEGYTMMTKEEYLDHDNGFNTPNGAWMLCCTYKQDQPNIRDNDGDSSWASMMCLEINPKTSGCGYASNYGQYMNIDRHLYETIPVSDYRKMCFIDFAIDDKIKALKDEQAKLALLAPYTSYAASVYNTGYTTGPAKGVGGLPLKFRVAGGAEGRDNQHVGFAVSVPLMRVEEMYLIEAEATGRLNEGEGIELLTKFAKQKDPNYVYGTHNEAYGNPATSQFINEVWWQRRVELWGEGFSAFDIKRFKKGIIRSYPNSNHVSPHKYNLDTTPSWMTSMITRIETNYNDKVIQNDVPVPPSGDSPEHNW